VSFSSEVLHFGAAVTGVPRLLHIRYSLSEWIGREPALIVLEGYSYGSAQRAHEIGELGGIIRVELHLSAVPWAVVPPAVLKKFVTGKGNAPKDVVRLEAYKRFGIEADTGDEVEARCLALMGVHRITEDVSGLTKPQVESLYRVWGEEFRGGV
jgi:crossover junction endodeoxyribonuclease RuvC